MWQEPPWRIPAILQADINEKKTVFPKLSTAGTLHNIHQNPQDGNHQHRVGVDGEIVQVWQSLECKVKDEDGQNPNADDGNDCAEDFDAFVAEIHIRVSAFLRPCDAERANDEGQTISD